MALVANIFVFEGDRPLRWNANEILRLLTCIKRMWTMQKSLFRADDEGVKVQSLVFQTSEISGPLESFIRTLEATVTPRYLSRSYSQILLSESH